MRDHGLPMPPGLPDDGSTLSTDASEAAVAAVERPGGYPKKAMTYGFGATAGGEEPVQPPGLPEPAASQVWDGAG